VIIADKEATVFMQSHGNMPGGTFIGVYQGNHEHGVTLLTHIQGRKTDVMIPWRNIRYITQDKGAA